jgi:hypothetical protein
MITNNPTLLSEVTAEAKLNLTWAETAVEINNSIVGSEFDISGNDIRVVVPIDDYTVAVFYEYEGKRFYAIENSDGDLYIQGTLYGYNHAVFLIENDFNDPFVTKTSK